MQTRVGRDLRLQPCTHQGRVLCYPYAPNRKARTSPRKTIRCLALRIPKRMRPAQIRGQADRGLCGERDGGP